MRSSSFLIVVFSVLLFGCDQQPPKKQDRSAQGLYFTSCASCHESGRLGAPSRGSMKEWDRRSLLGTEVLEDRVKNGYKGMPAMGMCHDCSDAEIALLVNFIRQPR